MERLLITGIAGGLGRLVAMRLRGEFDLCGVDTLPWEGHPRDLRIHRADLRSKRLEDVFRREQPRAVVHLGLVRHFKGRPQERHNVNLVGTKNLLESCARHGVKRLIFLSSSYVYGALPENPFYMDEETALNVSRHYPDIRDLAEVDTLCGTFLWKYPEIATAILRPVNTLGDLVPSTIGSYLKLRWVPTVLGFDPLMQFIHEADVAEAIACALESSARGVFNVTGPGAVPLAVAIEETGGQALPLPETLARAAVARLFRYGVYPFPADAIDFVKYPCTVDGRSFRSATRFRPGVSLENTLHSVRR